MTFTSTRYCVFLSLSHGEGTAVCSFMWRFTWARAAIERSFLSSLLLNSQCWNDYKIIVCVAVWGRLQTDAPRQLGGGACAPGATPTAARHHPGDCWWSRPPAARGGSLPGHALGASHTGPRWGWPPYASHWEGRYCAPSPKHCLAFIIYCFLKRNYANKWEYFCNTC